MTVKYSNELVGPAVEVKRGVHQGEHGVQEDIEEGKPSAFIPTSFLCGVICIVLNWPLSSIVFGLVILGQFLCAPCCHHYCGTPWCMTPYQVTYIHALYVVHHTLQRGFWSFLCCCSHCWVNLQPGILFGTIPLNTPPRFMFDEDDDKPCLLTLDEYIEAKKGTFPAFSGKHRAIDGGGNNRTYTWIGQGARGYAMTEPFCILSPSALPDPVAMAKALQFRKTFRPAPLGQNAIATWFANVAIHDFFRSATGKDAIDGVDKPWVNLHSSYLDLQVVYGWNKDVADSVRTFEDGKLKGIAETRLDRQEQNNETKAIIILLMREHNYVCEQLKMRYGSEFATDEALYQQARLIMGGVFINIILRQYGDQMFGENAPNGKVFAELRQNSYGWFPDAFGVHGLKHHQNAGNHLTFNFNIIYRWHTSIPAEWDPANPPKMETDDDLRKIFSDTLSQKAGGFGPNNMPEELFQENFSVPAASIIAGRKMGCPRLNDFRRRFAAPYRSFEQMTRDPEVAKRLAEFYPTVDDVELAVGCQVERSMFGGWNLGDTLGIFVLFDAFNSIRQDRFYTTDYTPAVYTEWGYEHTKTTILADLLNRHLQMDLPREIMLARVPTWEPPDWRDMQGYPFSNLSFDARGAPILN